VLAHRGASAAAPENTLAAFALAREQGADGVELDVRATSDGVLVCHHDPEVAGFGALAAHPFAALREAVPSVPTLAEALAELRGLSVNVEVKCLPWEPDADGDGQVMRRTVDALRDEDRARIIVSSFDLGAVDGARDHDPTLQTAWLTHGQDPRRAATLVLEHGHGWLNPDRMSVLAAPAASVAACHGRGLRVSVWTVDDPGEVSVLAAAGVDAIITNVPDVALSALR
jgi:glycerophosphoryl diester phosphodiesterase